MTRAQAIDRAVQAVIGPQLATAHLGVTDSDELEKRIARLMDRYAPRIRELAKDLLSPPPPPLCATCGSAATTVVAGQTYCDTHERTAPRRARPVMTE